MAEQQTLEIGNSLILLTDTPDDFADGYTNGSLLYSDERYRPPFPLTSEIITTFMVTNITDPRKSERWNAGFIAGWMEALSENHPETFTSKFSQEDQERQTDQLRLTVLEE